MSLVDQKAPPGVLGKWVETVEVKTEGSRSLLPPFYKRGAIIEIVFIAIL